jgi:hypothetical protein
VTGIIIFVAALALFAALCAVALARPQSLAPIRARATVGRPATSAMHELTVLPPTLARGLQGARAREGLGRWRPCSPPPGYACSRKRLR